MEVKHLIELLSELTPGTRCKYVRGDDECTFVKIDPQEQRLYTKTPLNEEFSFAQTFIVALANKIEENVPFNTSQLLNNKGSNRAVIDSIIAHTSEFYWLQKDRSKFTVWVPSAPHNAGELVEWKDIKALTHNSRTKNIGSSEPLQQIFYGAPGTGKSFKIDKDTKGHAVIRTTFHPDSDYSTFVGAYKPVMEECNVKVTPIVTNNGVSLQPIGTYKERRIAYKFVKQAFLKAYLGAWKKYADKGSSQKSSVVLTATNGEKFILTEVEKEYVGHTKESNIAIGLFEKDVKDYWNNNVIPNKPDKWKWFPSLVCDWYYEPEEEEQTAEGCWEAFKKELNDNNNTFTYSKRNQTYLMKLDGGNITISTCKVKKAWRNTIETEYKSNDPQGISSQATIARKLKEYGGTFERAWEKLKEDVKASQSSSTNTSDSKALLPQFLIIEEINRGNCAQIFGDLFQLLDRSDNGFSTYPIEADSDIKDEVARAFKEEKEYKLLSDISIEGAVKDYTSNYKATLSEDVQEGRILLLPPNLYIWATMNTSDQSLFPIDSAFKRRWDWVYIPISEGRDKNGQTCNWVIEADTQKYSWWSFVQKINDEIYEKTNSEDKKLGYYFCIANNGIITVETFVSKVLFYLWNDVFKDFGSDNGLFIESYDKFYDCDSKGIPFINKDKVQDLLNRLKVQVVGDIEEVDSEGDAGQERQYSTARFKLNGEGRFGKSRIALEALKVYANANPEATGTDIVNAWSVLGIPNMIETSETHADRVDRSDDDKISGKWNELRLHNGEFIYLTNQFRGEKINTFISAVNAQPWGMHIEKIEE